MSLVWERSVQAIGEPPAGVHWIHIGDRYSDMFPFLSRCRQRHCDFDVRAAQDRCVDLLVEQADTPAARRSHHQRRPQQHLFEIVRGWSAQGEQDLDLDATKQSRARTAHLALSFGSLRLLPPEGHQESSLRPLVVWVVRVWEPDPPEGVEGLSWVLLTSVPVQTLEQAWERVDWYRARWIVEDYHQGLKTGCRIELRQVQSYEGLLVGSVGARRGATAATAGSGQAESGAAGPPGAADGPRAGRRRLGSGASHPVDRPAVLVHDCALWRLSGTQRGRPTRLENPVERLVLHASSARRGPCSCSTSFRLGFDLKIVINSQTTSKVQPCHASAKRRISLPPATDPSLRGGVTRCDGSNC